MVPDRASPCYTVTQDEEAIKVYDAMKNDQPYIKEEVVQIPLMEVFADVGPISEELPMDAHTILHCIYDPQVSSNPCVVSFDRHRTNPLIFNVTVAKHREMGVRSILQKLGIVVTYRFGPTAWKMFKPEFKRQQQKDFKYDEHLQIFTAHSDDSN